MTVFSFVFALSVILSIGAVLFVLKLSHRKKWYDHIDERKIHSGNIPRIGGIGFVSAFFIIMLFLGIYNLVIGENIVQFIPCAIAMGITFISGAYDDFRPMSPRYKLLLQCLAALIVILFGFDFDRIFYNGPGLLTNLGYLSIPITFIWIVGITNAINLIDGVDGLAGGVSALIAFFLGVIFFSFAGPSKAVLLCASLLGVLIGFLVFNAPFPRAKIFMGDCGAQFLGFTLALIPLMKEPGRPSSLPLLYVAALFAIPIFDTLSAVWRRIRDGQKIYDPDKAHLHHKLMYLGLKAKGINAIIYSLQIVIGILVYFSVKQERLSPGSTLSLVFLGIVFLVTMIFFITIHYLNRAKIKKNLESKTLPNTNTLVYGK